MEDLLKEEQVTIGVLDQQAQELLGKTKDVHAEAETRIDACATLQADLERRLPVGAGSGGEREGAAGESGGD
jgi:hypothetical protein